MLCSDGLTGHLDDSSILKILQQPKDSKTLCRDLIKRANKLGGKDNITAVVVKVGHKRRKLQRKINYKYALIAGGSAIVFVLSFFWLFGVDDSGQKLNKNFGIEKTKVSSQGTKEQTAEDNLWESRYKEGFKADTLRKEAFPSLRKEMEADSLTGNKVRNSSVGMKDLR